MNDLSEYIKCINCGKQNIILPDDPYDVKCEFGDHPVRIKQKQEATIVNEGITNAEESPPTPASLLQTGSSPGTPPLYEGKPLGYDKGKRKWAKKCRECDNSYRHDEILWCSKKRCPRNCPKKFRPQYRPRIVATKKHREASKKSGTIASPDGIKPVTSSPLPPYPEFKEGWPGEVKIAWLQGRVKMERLNFKKVEQENLGTHIETMVSSIGRGFSSALNKQDESPSPRHYPDPLRRAINWLRRFLWL